MELHIPKDWFKNNLVDNPDYNYLPSDFGYNPKESDWNRIRKGDYQVDKGNLKTFGYKNGGRTSNFKEIPPEFIKKVCLDVNNSECYDVDEYLKLIGDK